MDCVWTAGGGEVFHAVAPVADGFPVGASSRSR